MAIMPPPFSVWTDAALRLSVLARAEILSYVRLPSIFWSMGSGKLVRSVSTALGMSTGGLGVARWGGCMEYKAGRRREGAAERCIGD
jgi:hypothetical protein